MDLGADRAPPLSSELCSPRPICICGHSPAGVVTQISPYIVQVTERHV